MRRPRKETLWLTKKEPCGCREPHPPSSGCHPVLVDEAALRQPEDERGGEPRQLEDAAEPPVEDSLPVPAATRDGAAILQHQV
jgi:hypothetical protein